MEEVGRGLDEEIDRLHGALVASELALRLLALPGPVAAEPAHVGCPT